MTHDLQAAIANTPYRLTAGTSVAAVIGDPVKHSLSPIIHNVGFLSLGIDHLWRKKAIKQLKNLEVKKVIDIATGIGDFAIASLKLNPYEVIGVDISSGMLEV